MSRHHAAQRERALQQRVADIRSQLLELAGINEQAQARGLKLAWQRMQQQLDAKKFEVVTVRGKVRRIATPDNANQLRAAEAIATLVGANATKQQIEPGAPIIHIHFPAVCDPTPYVVVDAVPERARLVSAENHSEEVV
jgi:hypothetical protein